MHKPNVSKLHVDERTEYRLRRGMPWLFDKYCSFDRATPQLGDLVAIYGKRNQCIGIGLFDPHSPIRVRVLGAPGDFSKNYLEQRFEDALKRRADNAIANAHTNGLRLLNGESEGLPGFVLDAYADTWVLKVYAACWLPYIHDFIDVLSSYTSKIPNDIQNAAYTVVPKRIVLRFGRECRSYFEKIGLNEAQLVAGSDDTPYADFLEHGAKFRAQVFRGQKTGFFLDQRLNRQLIRSLSADKKVLDICCYSGGFSVNAAIGAAQSVWSLDGDRHALDLVREHYNLNADNPGVANAEHVLQRANMFEWLEHAKSKRMLFDLIIADPPSFASSQAQLPTAEKAYLRLFAAAADCLKPRGQILCCSCSSHVGAEKFATLVKRALLHRTLDAVDYTGLPPDHVAKFAEARYLKAWLITVK